MNKVGRIDNFLQFTKVFLVLGTMIMNGLGDTDISKLKPPGTNVPAAFSRLEENANLHYLISALAPAASSFLTTSSASSLETASLTGFGAPSQALWPLLVQVLLRHELL